MSTRVAKKIIMRSQREAVVRRAANFRSWLPDFRYSVGEKRTATELSPLAEAVLVREQGVDNSGESDAATESSAVPVDESHTAGQKQKNGRGFRHWRLIR